MLILTINNETLYRSVFFALIACFLNFSGAAQDANKISSINIKPTAVAPKIDGVLTEGEWDKSAPLQLTKQAEPQKFSPATEKTEVRIFAPPSIWASTLSIS